MSDGAAQVGVVRVRHGSRVADADVVAVEAPLEVRVDGHTLAVLMRTPGDDRALVAGFLLSERLIRTLDDVATIEHCTDPELAVDDPRRQTVRVTLEGAASARAAAALNTRRDIMASSACGVCGRATLDALRDGLAPATATWTMRADVLAGLPLRLRERQLVFASTGGLHAAGLFDAEGQMLQVAEDVGRHNAVDKIVGTCLLHDTLPLSRAMLLVSGRTSFEIVQKAWCAGIPVVASVSAPSSLAVTLATDAGITLVGFVRDGGLNIYSGANRVV